jgi:predicted transcriptional regulator
LRSNKRSKVDIYSAVLDSICREGGQLVAASPTRVAHRANIPYDRFQRIIDQFIELKLVERTPDGLLITQNGLNCLSQIRKTHEFLRRMGLSV